jgi:hypothetical protein
MLSAISPLDSLRCGDCGSRWLLAQDVLDRVGSKTQQKNRDETGKNIKLG